MPPVTAELFPFANIRRAMFLPQNDPARTWSESGFICPGKGSNNTKIKANNKE
jgi:hypothetical protein